jgi:protein-L-isoaspartate(D-aspartate) O-methyltransferase
LLGFAGCGPREAPEPPPAPGAQEDADARSAEERERMVARQLERRAVHDERVLAAMRRVPRHRFVPAEERAHAYADRPLPIGFGQTISQPYIVAVMSEALALQGHERVLEVGCGSGYQAAVLGELAREVWTIEIVTPLAERAARTLAELGHANVHVKAGDGYLGWPEHAPFDAILVAAASERVPQPLVDQLAVGGRMILPLGSEEQELVLLRKTPAGLERESILPVRFVPLTGPGVESLGASVHPR